MFYVTDMVRNYIKKGNGPKYEYDNLLTAVRDVKAGRMTAWRGLPTLFRLKVHIFFNFNPI